MFQEELGLLKGYQASIYVDPTARPRFFRPRPVPYSMRSLIEQELERLVQSGVLKPVLFADWSAPIVPVLKSDKKSVRICGDFSVTVNQVSRVIATRYQSRKTCLLDWLEVNLQYTRSLIGLSAD